MKNFFEWCKDKGLNLEACQVVSRSKFDTGRPVAPRTGKKISGTKGDPGKWAGTKVRHQYDDLSKDYKGNWSMNGTVDPFQVKSPSGVGKPVADIGK
jgi:hypothetical protein